MVIITILTAAAAVIPKVIATGTGAEPAALPEATAAVSAKPVDAPKSRPASRVIVATKFLTVYGVYVKVKITMAMKIEVFTGRRRELLAKTLMDIAKIIVAAIFANEFFLKFAFWISLLLGVLAFLIAGAGVLVHPKGE